LVYFEVELMSFIVKWTDMPDQVCENFTRGCGWDDSISADEYFDNMEAEFAQFKAYELYDDESLREIEFDRVVFENEAYYTWFVMRFS
jgi:hypothetical protein